MWLWVVVLFVGGIYARRHFFYGLVTGAVAIPLMGFMGTLVGSFFLGLCQVIIDFFQWESWLMVICCLLAHVLVLLMWLAWVKMTRETHSSAKHGRMMPSSGLPTFRKGTFFKPYKR
ncbi:hypothetical protein [Persicirhabdus sediminis]|uniref:Uncharacterized protein n=1 Tax=Persicirhabdus sediminis TaxID=454144 RepID=A0A8J7MG01_9BACT|nr:hypothetical protein [Persicirhabdus sediminis]MBK1792801.1 hypothetical protein [Persicirhabdus sediminis]